MTRTNTEMNEIAIEIGSTMSTELEKYPGIGAVLVVYELEGAEKRIDSPIAFTAFDYSHVRPVLAQVLKLTRQIPVLKGDKPQ